MSIFFNWYYQPLAWSSKSYMVPNIQGTYRTPSEKEKDKDKEKEREERKVRLPYRIMNIRYYQCLRMSKPLYDAVLPRSYAKGLLIRQLKEYGPHL